MFIRTIWVKYNPPALRDFLVQPHQEYKLPCKRRMKLESGDSGDHTKEETFYVLDLEGHKKCMRQISCDLFAYSNEREMQAD